jgi:hypothetical protein
MEKEPKIEIDVNLEGMKFFLFNAIAVLAASIKTVNGNHGLNNMEAWLNF